MSVVYKPSTLRYLFIFYFFFSAVLGLHCCMLAFSCYSEEASHCGGFSCGGQALGYTGFTSYSSWALGARAQQLWALLSRVMWDLP